MRGPTARPSLFVKSIYQVAGHCFSVCVQKGALAEIFKGLMDNYAPFFVPAEDFAEQPATESEQPALVFSLDVCGGEAPRNFAVETSQQDEGQEIVCGHNESGESFFEFFRGKTSSGVLVCSSDYSCGTLYVNGCFPKFALDNALMIMFALSTANKDTALFHGAVVSYKGNGYMFLGKSGTGKSTHARLWLKHIAGTELVNDDNPVVRLGDNGATIFGSPWSGKTPCYKNLQMPLGAVVQLEQAPFNEIVRLNGLMAYAVLVPSISGKRWDKTIADGLHKTENALAQNVPAFYLKCLPDQAAAELSCMSVAGDVPAMKSQRN